MFWIRKLLILDPSHFTPRADSRPSAAWLDYGSKISSANENRKFSFCGPFHFISFCKKALMVTNEVQNSFHHSIPYSDYSSIILLLFCSGCEKHYWNRKSSWCRSGGKTSSVEDNAKDGRPGKVRLLCSFYHEPLRTWIETSVNKFAISNHTALKIHFHSLRS